MTGTPAARALYAIWRWSSPWGHEDRRRRILGPRPPPCGIRRSSRTIAARRSAAEATSPLLRRWSRWRTRSCSRRPSRARRWRITRRSCDFFRARRLRRRKCVACTTRTPGNATVTRRASPSPTATPSREVSFVSRAIAASGAYGSGAAFRTTTTIRSGVTVSDPSPHEASWRMDRCHTETGRTSCTPSVPWIGIRNRPVSRSRRYD